MRILLCNACKNEWAELRMVLGACPYCRSTSFALVKEVQ